HDAGRRPPDGLALGTVGRRGGRLLRRRLLLLRRLCRGLDGWLLAVAVAVGFGVLIGEEIAPALGDRGRIGPVLLVHLVDEPCVLPEGGVLFSHRQSQFYRWVPRSLRGA